MLTDTKKNYLSYAERINNYYPNYKLSRLNCAYFISFPTKTNCMTWNFCIAIFMACIYTASKVTNKYKNIEKLWNFSGWTSL